MGISKNGWMVDGPRSAPAAAETPGTVLRPSSRASSPGAAATGPGDPRARELARRQPAGARARRLPLGMSVSASLHDVVLREKEVALEALEARLYDQAQSAFRDVQEAHDSASRRVRQAKEDFGERSERLAEDFARRESRFRRKGREDAERISALEGRLSTAQHQLAVVRAELRAKERTVLDLENQVHQLRLLSAAGGDAARSDGDDAPGELTAAEALVGADELSRLREKIAKLSLEVGRLRSDNLELEKALKREQSAGRAAGVELERGSQRLLGLQASLSAALEENALLSRTVEDLRRATSTMKLDREEERAILGARAEEALSEAKRLRDTHAQLSASAAREALALRGACRGSAARLLRAAAKGRNRRRLLRAWAKWRGDMAAQQRERHLSILSAEQKASEALRAAQVGAREEEAGAWRRRHARAAASRDLAASVICRLRSKLSLRSALADWRADALLRRSLRAEGAAAREREASDERCGALRAELAEAREGAEAARRSRRRRSAAAALRRVLSARVLRRKGRGLRALRESALEAGLRRRLREEREAMAREQRAQSEAAAREQRAQREQWQSEHEEQREQWRRQLNAARRELEARGEAPAEAAAPREGGAQAQEETPAQAEEDPPPPPLLQRVAPPSPPPPSPSDENSGAGALLGHRGGEPLGSFLDRVYASVRGHPAPSRAARPSALRGADGDAAEPSAAAGEDAAAAALALPAGCPAARPSAPSAPRRAPRPRGAAPPPRGGALRRRRGALRGRRRGLPRRHSGRRRRQRAAPRAPRRRRPAALPRRPRGGRARPPALPRAQLPARRGGALSGRRTRPGGGAAAAPPPPPRPPRAARRCACSGGGWPPSWRTCGRSGTACAPRRRRTWSAWRWSRTGPSAARGRPRGAGARGAAPGRGRGPAARGRGRPPWTPARGRGSTGRR